MMLPAAASGVRVSSLQPRCGPHDARGSLRIHRRHKKEFGPGASQFQGIRLAGPGKFSPFAPSWGLYALIVAGWISHRTAIPGEHSNFRGDRKNDSGPRPAAALLCTSSLTRICFCQEYLVLARQRAAEATIGGGTAFTTAARDGDGGGDDDAKGVHNQDQEEGARISLPLAEEPHAPRSPCPDEKESLISRAELYVDQALEASLPIPLAHLVKGDILALRGQFQASTTSRKYTPEAVGLFHQLASPCRSQQIYRGTFFF